MLMNLLQNGMTYKFDFCEVAASSKTLKNCSNYAQIIKGVPARYVINLTVYVCLSKVSNNCSGPQVSALGNRLSCCLNDLSKLSFLIYYFQRVLKHTARIYIKQNHKKQRNYI